MPRVVETFRGVRGHPSKQDGHAPKAGKRLRLAGTQDRDRYPRPAGTGGRRTPKTGGQAPMAGREAPKAGRQASRLTSKKRKNIQSPTHPYARTLRRPRTCTDTHMYTGARVFKFLPSNSWHIRHQLRNCNLNVQPHSWHSSPHQCTHRELLDHCPTWRRRQRPKGTSGQIVSRDPSSPWGFLLRTQDMLLF